MPLGVAANPSIVTSAIAPAKTKTFFCIHGVLDRSRFERVMVVTRNIAGDDLRSVIHSGRDVCPRRRPSAAGIPALRDSSNQMWPRACDTESSNTRKKGATNENQTL